MAAVEEKPLLSSVEAEEAVVQTLDEEVVFDACDPFLDVVLCLGNQEDP